jgi:hypothetical protein
MHKTASHSPQHFGSPSNNPDPKWPGKWLFKIWDDEDWHFFAIQNNETGESIHLRTGFNPKLQGWIATLGDDDSERIPAKSGVGVSR